MLSPLTDEAWAKHQQHPIWVNGLPLKKIMGLKAVSLLKVGSYSLQKITSKIVL
jgi:hypothetical protein